MKGSEQLHFVVLDKPLNEIYLARIKEQYLFQRTCWYYQSLCAVIVDGITLWNQKDIETCS